MHVEDHDPLERLQEAARGYRNTRAWPRVQAILLAEQGDTAPRIARAQGFSRRAVQAWVAAYNRGGLEALPDRPHPGRTPTLPHGPEPRRTVRGRRNKAASSVSRSSRPGAGLKTAKCAT